MSLLSDCPSDLSTPPMTPSELHDADMDVDWVRKEIEPQLDPEFIKKTDEALKAALVEEEDGMEWTPASEGAQSQEEVELEEKLQEIVENTDLPEGVRMCVKEDLGGLCADLFDLDVWSLVEQDLHSGPPVNETCQT